MLLILPICFFLITMASEPWPEPFLMKFNGGLNENTRVTVCLEVPTEITGKFFLDFVKDSQNIIFHLEAQFNTKTTTCSSTENGKWGPPEIKKDYFPFEAGKKYRMDFDFEVDYIKVYVDNKLFVQFKHRVKPTKEIKSLNVYNAKTFSVIVAPIAN